jgi:L-alanine-DL-glutamate epimerase-like enolase superfamily enzyme
MRVRSTEVFLLHGTYVFVRVETDEGVVGWGSTGYHRGGQTEGAMVLAQVTAGLGGQLVGEDASNISDLWTRAFRRGYRLGSTGAQIAALSAIDIALHDCKGRQLGTPVWNLLGGRWRDQIPVYGSLMKRGRSLEENAELTSRLQGSGHRQVKLHTGTRWGLDQADDDDTVPVARILRERCGDIGIMLDLNQSYTPIGALRVGRQLEALDVIHFEEPIAPWDLDGYARLSAALDLPLAAGEQCHNLWQFEELITRGRLDIIQPNVTTAGGFTQLMKIATLGELHNRPLVCHNTDPTLSTVAHLHLWAASTAFSFPQEYLGEPTHVLLDDTPILAAPPTVRAGTLAVPEGPGLGIEIDEELIRHNGVAVA